MRGICVRVLPAGACLRCERGLRRGGSVAHGGTGASDAGATHGLITEKARSIRASHSWSWAV
jgi:hypothetical protein